MAPGTSSKTARGADAMPDDQLVGDPKDARDFVVTQLVAWGYRQTISPKMLEGLTTTVFRSVLAFLFDQIDSTIDLKKGESLVKALPPILATLRYTGPVSKTALAAVGAMHTREQHFRIIYWLVKLVEYHMATDEDDGEAAGSAEAWMWKYLSEGYHAYMAGNDDAMSALDAEVEQMYASKMEEARRDIEDTRARNDELRAQLEALRGEESSLPALRQRKEDLLSDKGKFHTLIDQLEKRHAALEARIEARQEELAAQEGGRKEAEARLAEVQATVDQQELSLADVARLKEEQQYRREQIESLAAQKTAKDKEHWEAEKDLSKAADELAASVEQYTTQAIALGIMDPEAPLAGGVDFAMRATPAALEGNAAGRDALRSSALGRAGAPAAILHNREAAVRALLDADVDQTLRPALSKLRTVLRSQTAAANMKLLEVKDDARQISDALEDARRSAKQHREFAAKLKETYDREKDAVTRQLTTVSGELETIEEQIREARDRVEAAAEAARAVDDSALRLLEAQIGDEEAGMERERAETRRRLMDAAALVDRHRQRLSQRLQAFKASMQADTDAAMA